MEKMVIRAVDLEKLIDVLTSLYDRGVNYADMLMMRGKDRDTLSLSINRDYIDEEFIDDFDFLEDGFEEDNKEIVKEEEIKVKCA